MGRAQLGTTLAVPQGSRILPQNLTPAERRVLDAFYCGRLPAGRLAAALSVARQADGPAEAEQRTRQVPRLRLAA